MNFYRPTASDLQAFQRDGFVIVPGLLTSEETDLLNKVARLDKAVSAKATSRADAQGGTTTLALSNDLSDDFAPAIVRCRRVADSMSQFLGDEVYHYHHKMMLKEPKIGGAWEWHQDYGYWYDYGCLYPHMASCYIAIDPAHKANGCLQVIPGSHHLGRINHGKVGGQTGADPEHVDAVLQRLPILYVEMKPGDGLFFHGNLLHRSDQNLSDDPRWALICCYNTKSNNPYKESRHPTYSPLDLIEDQDLIKFGQRQLHALQASQ